MTRINLLKETITFLAYWEHTPEEVKFVCGVNDLTYRDWRCSWEVFALAANTIDYPERDIFQVSKSLLVVGDNWWLERHHDGVAEWWEYRRYPADYWPHVDTLTCTDIMTSKYKE